mmetsp:Transcript_3888/g.11151  ORF Transcript_3888/g.11151 Transcript_3888/m.11151 type:complete len:236 (-) Transcript_3888:220-927(-)
MAQVWSQRLDSRVQPETGQRCVQQPSAIGSRPVRTGPALRANLRNLTTRSTPTTYLQDAHRPVQVQIELPAEHVLQRRLDQHATGVIARTAAALLLRVSISNLLLFLSRFRGQDVRLPPLRLPRRLEHLHVFWHVRLPPVDRQPVDPHTRLPWWQRKRRLQDGLNRQDGIAHAHDLCVPRQLDEPEGVTCVRDAINGFHIQMTKGLVDVICIDGRTPGLPGHLLCVLDNVPYLIL